MKSVYIHIPFCDKLCSYCDFCKLLYQKKWINDYLNALSLEIKGTYKGEPIRTLYIGGGTPTTLDINELSQLFEIINQLDLSNLEEFTIECNIENLTTAKIDLFKQYHVNRLSIGIQTFNDKYLTFLNRQHTTNTVFELIDYIKQQDISNINIDLIYGLPNQTMEELKQDLHLCMQLNVPHLSLYSLIIEEHTKIYIEGIQPLDEDVNATMYNYINKYLNKHHFHHYEISNYAKKGYESKHNLVYWNNEEYYGFGLGASSYINNYRYENSRSLTTYIDGNYIYQKHLLSKKEMMENEMILGLRKTDGVDKKKFFTKYQQSMEDIFPIKKLKKEKALLEKKNKVFIPSSRLFLSNEILINFID